MPRASSRTWPRAPCLANLSGAGSSLCRPGNRARLTVGRPQRRIEPVLHATDPIAQPLAELCPVRLELVEQSSSRALFAHLLHAYHYLSYSRPVGENLRFLIRDREQRPLGCLLFGAAAWKVAARDQFLGWDAATRARHLPLLANNMRFLVLPWVRVPHLASHALGLAARELSALWQKTYGLRKCPNYREGFAFRVRLEAVKTGRYRTAFKGRDENALAIRGGLGIRL